MAGFLQSQVYIHIPSCFLDHKVFLPAELMEMATYHYVGASVLGLTLAIVDTGFEEYRYVFNLVQMKTLFKMGLDLWNVLQVK